MYPFKKETVYDRVKTNTKKVTSEFYDELLKVSQKVCEQIDKLLEKHSSQSIENVYELKEVKGLVEHEVFRMDDVKYKRLIDHIMTSYKNMGFTVECIDYIDLKFEW